MSDSAGERDEDSINEGSPAGTSFPRTCHILCGQRGARPAPTLAAAYGPTGVRLNQFSASPLNLQIWNRSRSMGLKLLVVSGLALIMTIPALFVDNLVEERTKRAKDVIQEVSGRVGGEQTFLGPVLSHSLHDSSVLQRCFARAWGVHSISNARRSHRKSPH